MNQDLEALLVVQRDDEVIREIEAQRDALSPRIKALDKARQRAAEDVAKCESTLSREQEKLRALESRITDHRARHDKNLEVLNNAQKLKEATAASAQVEAARKVLADDESELLVSTRRVTDLRTQLAAYQEVLQSVSTEQESARSSLAGELAEIDARLETARAHRERSTEGIDKGLLLKYDKVQARRRSAALYEVHGNFACGSCDTAMPVQRRPKMATGAIIEICEACGVLLYFRPAAVEPAAAQ